MWHGCLLVPACISKVTQVAAVRLCQVTEAKQPCTVWRRNSSSQKTTVELPTWLKRRQRNHVCRRWQMSTNFLGRLRQCKLVVVQPLDNHLFLPGKTPGLEMPSTPSVMFHGIISDGCRLAPLECHPHADFAITFATFN